MTDSEDLLRLWQATPLASCHLACLVVANTCLVMDLGADLAVDGAEVIGLLVG
jgi:hypothetical protein